MRTITETRVTCSACGNIWHYGKAEKLEAAGAALSNTGKAMMCCSGCAPALLIPNKEQLDLSKCQKCGSRAIKEETIEHEAP